MNVATQRSGKPPYQGNGALLSTACVTLESPTGRRVSVRALLHSSAEESFLTEHVAQALSLRKKATIMVVSGVGGEPTVVAKHTVKVSLKSDYNSDFDFQFSALVLRKLTALLPRSAIPRKPWPHLDELQLTDPHFGSPARVDCILSSAAYAAAILPGVRKGPVGTPVALNSVFGWVLMGSIDPNSESSVAQLRSHHISVDHDLTKLVERFWEIEEVPMEKLMSPEEESCYAHFKATHTQQRWALCCTSPIHRAAPPIGDQGDRREVPTAHRATLYEAA